MTTTAPLNVNDRQQLHDRLELLKRQLGGMQFQQGQLFERETWHRQKLTAIHQDQAQLNECQRELRSEIESIEAKLGRL